MAFIFCEMLPNILHVNGLDFVKHSAASHQIVIFAAVFDQGFGISEFGYLLENN